MAKKDDVAAFVPPINKQVVMFLESILCAASGVQDATLGSLSSFQIVLRNSKIRSKVFLCFVLNGLILGLSVILFENVVLPLVLFSAHWITSVFSKPLATRHIDFLESLVSYTFTGLWLLPMFVICTPINNIWFKEIAIEAGHHVWEQKRASRQKWEVKHAVVDMLYGISVEALFMLQATLVSVLPVGGMVLSVIHTALLYSLYSFEYKWFNAGVRVQKRLQEIEVRWPYFLGFGLPLSLVTASPVLSPITAGRVSAARVVISACVFSIAFPLLILSAYRSTPGDSRFPRIPVFRLSKLICNKLFTFALPR